MTPINDLDQNDAEVENFTLGAEAPGVVCPLPYPFVQVTNACGSSDAGSHCSSMESLLEARRPDPEELLLELGFGGGEEPDSISRIPERFLKPSGMKGVAIDDFIKHQQMMVHTFQSGSSGYRGLTGPSHAMPSGIVGKIMDRLREAEMERVNQEALHGNNHQHHHHHHHHNRNPFLRHHHHYHPGLQNNNNNSSPPPPPPLPSLSQPLSSSTPTEPLSPPPLPPPLSVDRPQQTMHCAAAQTQTGYSPKLARLAHNLMVKMKGVKEVSVLSPENRNWYQSQGDKSPETAGRRIIIGHHSYTFAKDGNLIEDVNYERRESSSGSAVSRSDPDDWINSDIKLIINDGQGVMNEKASDSDVENIDREIRVEEKKDENGRASVQDELAHEAEEDFATEPSASSSNQTLPSPSSSLSSATSNASSQCDKEQLQGEYKCMLLLVSQLNNLENSVDLGSEDNFYSLSPDERKRLQVGVIEAALATYQKRLKELDLRSHLRELLDGRLHRVTDLLDDTASPSVVTIIKQMTSLLRHQESLRQELSMHEPPDT